MLYLENKPHSSLCNFVKCYWFSDTQEAEGEYTILPDGYFDLIYRFVGENHQKTFLTGTWVNPIDVPYVKHTRHFGVRFKLIASEYIFQTPIQQIIDSSLELPLDYWGTTNAVFNDFDNFKRHIENHIAVIIPTMPAIDPRKLKLFNILYSADGNISVNELSQKVGWSSRQINRWFNSRYGLSLKTFANILKCHAAYQSIAKGELKPVGNYHDQSHFIKVVKRFTGTTPKVLHENKNVRFLQLSTRGKE
ncbi:MAG: AraC family transcriptional regulator [Prolixibacteraceae bacterium]|nr:AraC family transcriptional regulator [Prolixibacteraceae bacterium]MBN2649634.1 AraC family transcriptional regulator [Prolixibacteraceae bacterium]